MGEPKRLLLALSSGAFLALSFPPFPLGFLSFVALVPLFFSLREATPKNSFLLGLSSGVLFSCGLLYWVAWVEVEGVVRLFLTLGVILLWFYLGLYVALFSLFTTLTRRRLGWFGLCAIPFYWTILEFIRSLSPQVGFPWGSLGYTLSHYPRLIQFASITGLPGLTFLVVTVNLLIYLLIRSLKKPKRSIWLGTATGLLLFLPYLHGSQSMKRQDVSQDNMKVGLLQINIEPQIKRQSRLYREYRISLLKSMTEEVAARGVDLIVWPETAIPGILNTGSRVMMQELSRDIGVPILSGTSRVEWKGRQRYRCHNSAIFATPESGIVQNYDKIYLVPFSERLPFDDVFPFLKSIHFGQGDFSPGNNYTVFSHPNGEFSTLICFESIFPRLVRQFVRRGARLLVNITEDSWFGRSPGPYQHAQMAILRAVEYRIGIARCANSGVSETIDPYGRVRKLTGIFSREIVVDSLPLRGGQTFYAKYGDLFAWICTGLAVVFLVMVKWRPFRASSFFLDKGSHSG